jgi:hypothetical protein
MVAVVLPTLGLMAPLCIIELSLPAEAAEAAKMERLDTAAVVHQD